VSAHKPPWWRAFDRAERTLGSRLEDIAASNRYVDVMVRGMKVQRAIGAGIGSAAGGAVERVLRVANIPSRSDIHRLSKQLAVLTSEVRALQIEQREALVARPGTDGPPPATPTRLGTRTAGAEATAGPPEPAVAPEGQQADDAS
jgi:hypothetical protein